MALFIDTEDYGMDSLMDFMGDDDFDEEPHVRPNTPPRAVAGPVPTKTVPLEQQTKRKREHSPDRTSSAVSDQGVDAPPYYNDSDDINPFWFCLRFILLVPFVNHLLVSTLTSMSTTMMMTELTADADAAAAADNDEDDDDDDDDDEGEE